MFSRSFKPSVVAALLAIGLAAAHAQGSPAAAGGAGPVQHPLDLTLHLPLQAQPAAAGADADLNAPAAPNDTAAAHPGITHEHPLAPRLEWLSGYDPYTAWDAMDFKPRTGVYALGLKIDF